MEKRSKHLRQTHFEQVQHCTNTHFQHKLNKERVNIAAHQKEDNKNMGKKETGEKRDKRSILHKLSAAFLRSFRGQLGSFKNVGSAQGKWYPWESQQPFQLTSNWVRDRTTTLRRLLLVQFYFNPLGFTIGT